jgi:hypothetical protein
MCEYDLNEKWETSTKFTGLFCWIAPVTVVDPEGDCMIAPRHIGYLMLPLAEVMVQLANMWLSSRDPFYTPHFPIYITGELK